MLGHYGIDADAWAHLQKLTDLAEDNGRAYLTAKDALRTDRGAIEAMLRERDPALNALAEQGNTDAVTNAVDAYQRGLADKLQAYFSDSSAHAVVTAGARERALLLGGTRPGSVAGEVLRFLTQFKMWPVAAYDQLIRREIHMSISRKDAWSGIGMLVALGTATGFMRLAIDNVAAGKPVPNPQDPKTLLTALAKSGALGVVGDMAFGETNREAGLISLAGPVVSDADKLFSVASKFKQDAEDAYNGRVHRNGAFGDVWSDLTRFGVNHMPAHNLIYLKGALDYLLFYHMYEAMSPGWWERTNRRLQHEQGRTMMGYSPGAGVPYSPFGGQR